MRKIILVNGLISGIIVSTMFLISYPLMRNHTLSTTSSMVIGYAAMVLSLSLVFVAIKTYRDQYLDGSISFGTAFKVGLSVATIASIIYAAMWIVASYTIASDYAEFYTECQMNDLRAGGASAEELAAAKTQMDTFTKLYENPLLRFVMTMLEIFPVGLVMTLIAALVLKKRQILPA
jgi:hypothetical protein